MAIDTSGLLTGLLTPSQRSQQRMNNNANMAQTGLMSQVLNLANTFTDATSNLVGADTRSPEQRAGQQVTELLQAGDIDGAINILKDVDPQAAMTLIARQKAEQERTALETAQRESMLQTRQRLASQATDLGLNVTAEQALDPNIPISEIMNELRTESQRQIVAAGGRDVRVRLARGVGADPETVQAILDGEYDNLATDEFLSFLQGDEATTEPFLDVNGEARIFKVNEAGNVWSDEAGKWVTPGELRLRRAPVRTENVEVVNAFANGAVQGAVETFNEAYTGVREAQQSLVNNTQAYDLLDSGIYSGAMAGFRSGLTSTLITLGVVDPNSSAGEQLRATQAYVARRAEEVGRIIKLFGSGTGLSDADREYAQNIAAGNVEMTEEAMRSILAMDKIANTNAIIEFNKDLDNKVAQNRASGGRQGLSETEASYFRIEQPEAIPRRYDNMMVGGEMRPMPVYEIRPGQWVTGSGLPWEFN